MSSQFLPIRRLPSAYTGLALLSVFFLFFKLGFEPLYDWDEGWYAQVALEMSEHNNWLHLSWQDRPFYDKPPLVFWMMAICIKLLGTGEWVMRLSSALCGVGCIGLTSLISFQLFNHHKIAIWSGLILLFSPPYLQNARMAMLDTPVLFGLLLGIFGALKSKEKPFFASLIGIGLGWAILSKGVIGFLLGVILIPFWIWEKESLIWKNKWLYGGLFLSSGFVIFWYSYQSYDFWKSHLGFHVWSRITQTLDGHSGSVLFYFNYLLSSWQPWIMLFIPTIPFLIKKQAESSSRLLICWILIPLGLFSLAQTKLTWYIQPIYPALSIALAHFLVETLKHKWYSKFLGSTLLLIGLVLTGVGVTLVNSLFPNPADNYWPTGLILGSGLILSGWLHLKHQAMWLSMLTLSTALSLFSLLFIGLNWNSYTGLPNPKPLNALILKHVPANQLVLTLNYPASPSFYFYTQHKNQTIDLITLTKQWDKTTNQWLIILEKDWKTVNHQLNDARVTGRTSEFLLLKN